jgi:hypothetical protein
MQTLRKKQATYICARNRIAQSSGRATVERYLLAAG